ncbi:Down syndrome cell adhesion molecule-like protein 1 homolog [Plectropomus leopardus]|uniref:Down syndrome cell adhesion molecule-like protein 1 homolog n=1 Tax=Plectropomus leopardus TaxID=160734 RepID=UPI001C4AF6AA|nr:Down syndrome cell adhesion molecule-like protein 1 homolog [Plectropomus leopardus]
MVTSRLSFSLTVSGETTWTSRLSASDCVMMNVSLLTAAQTHLCFSQRAAFPRVVPDRQQHYEYESVVFDCEGLDGLTGWRVMREIKAGVTICASQWEKSKGPCTINPAFSSDSGTYWCEAGEKRSNVVNITVTAGPVILDSPVLPVMVGDAVTLRCRKKRTSDLTADFFKDGVLIKSNSTGNLTLHSVFKTNEGLYKCRVSQTEESAESFLAVRREKLTVSHYGRV